MQHKHHPMKWIIWGLAAFFYFYEFFLRVAPSVMIPELMSALNVDATAIGALTAFYFYIYAPMQLPVGMLADRYGARKLLCLAAFVAGCGAFLFASATTFWVASIGRFLMGAGSSFGFVGMVYICSHWFPEKKRGILIGFGSSIGMLGAVAGEGPFREMIDLIGWRLSNVFLGVLGIVLALAIFLVVRSDPPEMRKFDEKKKKAKSHILSDLKIVCKNGYSWLNAAVSLFLYVATPGFAGLWGIPFVHTVYGMSIKLAGYAVSMVFVGWAIGGPVLGHFSDKLSRKKPILLFSSLIGAFLMAIVVYVSALPLWILFLLFFLIGFISGAQLLNYSYAIDLMPESVKGTAAAFNNCIVVIGAAAIQPLVGFVLDKNWVGQMEKGIRIYSPEAYKIALTFFPLAFLLAFIFGLFLKRMEPKRYIWQKFFTP